MDNIERILYAWNIRIMPTKLIPLSEWAKKNGIETQKAKDMARRGRLRQVAQYQKVPTRRVVIPEGFVLDPL